MSIIINKENTSVVQAPVNEGQTDVQNSSNAHARATSLMASSAATLLTASANATLLSGPSTVTVRPPSPLRPAVFDFSGSNLAVSLSSSTSSSTKSPSIHKDPINDMSRPRSRTVEMSGVGNGAYTRYQSIFHDRMLHPSRDEQAKEKLLGQSSPKARPSDHLSPSSYSGPVSPRTRASSSSTTERPPSPTPQTPRTPKGTPMAFWDTDQFYGQYFVCKDAYEQPYHDFATKDKNDPSRVAYEGFRKTVEVYKLYGDATKVEFGYVGENKYAKVRDTQEKLTKTIKDIKEALTIPTKGCEELVVEAQEAQRTLDRVQRRLDGAKRIEDVLKIIVVVESAIKKAELAVDALNETKPGYLLPNALLEECDDIPNFREFVRSRSDSSNTVQPLSPRSAHKTQLPSNSRPTTPQPARPSSTPFSLPPPLLSRSSSTSLPYEDPKFLLSEQNDTDYSRPSTPIVPQSPRAGAFSPNHMFSPISPTSSSSSDTTTREMMSSPSSTHSNSSDGLASPTNMQPISPNFSLFFP